MTDASKTVLTIGVLIVGAIVTFMFIEIFGGPVKVMGNPNKQDPAYNPAGYGQTGSKVAATANQATNVLNTIGKDSSQVGADIKEVGTVASSVVDFFNNLGGGSSSPPPETAAQQAQDFIDISSDIA